MKAIVLILSISSVLIYASCSQELNSDETTNTSKEVKNKAATSTSANEAEPHRYGGWYCPDNFGFTPVDVQNLESVPAVTDRLPTKEELDRKMSLINVDTEKYPDARALKMKLPKLARVFSEQKGMEELIIVIQAIIVQDDTIVGYRFPNGGNGSSRISEVSFLSDEEVTELGPQPYFYSNLTVNATTKEIWAAAAKTDYFKKLGQKFGEEEFFASDWNPAEERSLTLVEDEEKEVGYVGMVFGNYYLQIDYERNGKRFSEKMLVIDNEDSKSAELHFASGPYPISYDNSASQLRNWIDQIIKQSELDFNLAQLTSVR